MNTSSPKTTAQRDSLRRQSLPISKYSPTDSLSPVKRISESKCPIMLAYCSKLSKNVAMKLYPYQDQLRVSKLYRNEARFASLSHSNVVSFLGTKEQRNIQYKDKSVKVSYILMDLAFCDFEELLPLFHNEEKLARTYFLQMIEGLIYLHTQEMAHMDIKLGNLLLGSDYLLKITDFDSSYVQGDEKMLGDGSTNFRAPELINMKCTDPFMVDIYSAGIILFLLKFGYYPYDEVKQTSGYDLRHLMLNEPEAFWKAHEQIRGAKLDADEDFKDLFMAMVAEDPEERATFDEIKNCDWCRRSVYNEREINLIMKKSLQGKNTHHNQA